MGKWLHKKDKKDLLIYLKLYLSHKRNTLINLIQNFLNDYFEKKKKKDQWIQKTNEQKVCHSITDKMLILQNL